MKFSLLIVLSLFTIVQADTLIVALNASPPCVIASEPPTGFEVELIQQVAELMGHEVEFYLTSFDSVWADVYEGRADLAMATTTITSAREVAFDFSLPYFDSGLSISVLAKNEPSIISGIKNLLKIDNLKLLLYVFEFLLVVGILIWFVELFDKDTAFGLNPLKGILRGFYWASTTVTTVGYGDLAPKTFIGRLISVMTQWVGIGIAGALIASIAGSVFTQQAQSTIKDYHDLKGKRVATLLHTHPVDILRGLKAEVIETSSIDSCFLLLENKSVDCVVYDTPIILNYVRTTGSGKFTTIAGIFDPQYYGILFPRNSPYREDANRALLSLKENGSYKQIYSKWFTE
ncbi:MAG: transporter substrate-binding domain-containing protein [Candidatus Pacearchaeota archaeon]